MNELLLNFAHEDTLGWAHILDRLVNDEDMLALDLGLVLEMSYLMKGLILIFGELLVVHGLGMGQVSLMIGLSFDI